VISAEVDGRDVTVALLGGKTAGSRLRDFTRVSRWLEAAPCSGRCRSD